MVRIPSGVYFLARRSLARDAAAACVQFQCRNRDRDGRRRATAVDEEDGVTPCIYVGCRGLEWSGEVSCLVEAAGIEPASANDLPLVLHA